MSQKIQDVAVFNNIPSSHDASAYSNVTPHSQGEITKNLLQADEGTGSSRVGQKSVTPDVH